jgi:hypothetical protein
MIIDGGMPDNVRNDPSGQPGEEVRLTMAMDSALSKAIQGD